MNFKGGGGGGGYRKKAVKREQKLNLTQAQNKR